LFPTVWRCPPCGRRAERRRHGADTGRSIARLATARHRPRGASIIPTQCTIWISPSRASRCAWPTWMWRRPRRRTTKPSCCCTAKAFPGDYWAHTITTLIGQGYRVVVPDQIGFGKSSKPDIRYHFDLLARNTKMLLDSLGVTRAAIVGHSFGGMLSVYFARDYPEMTAVLALENPIGLEDYRSVIPPQSVEALIKTEMAQTPQSYRAFMAAFFVGWPVAAQHYVDIFSRVKQSPDYPRWARASALTYDMIFNEPIRHEYHLLKMPVLLVIGQSDRSVFLPPLRLARRDQAARQLAGARPRSAQGSSRRQAGRNRRIRSRLAHRKAGRIRCCPHGVPDDPVSLKRLRNNHRGRYRQQSARRRQRARSHARDQHQRAARSGEGDTGVVPGREPHRRLCRCYAADR